VLCRYRLARKNKGEWKKPFVKNSENAKHPEIKLLMTKWLQLGVTFSQSIKIANDQSLLVDLECEGTLLLQRNCGSCNVVFSKKVKQRGTKLTVRAKIMPEVMQGIDLILGMDHLKQFGVELNCQRDTIEVHTPEAGKAGNKKKKYEEKGDFISTIMAMTDAAKREALSPQQAAKSIRRGDKSWLMLVQKEKADGLGVFAAGASMLAQRAAKKYPGTP
jgi:hypothetical protein